jgi:hypothetical protein
MIIHAGKPARQNAAYRLAWGMLIGALPWLFSIDERPLVITYKSELVQKSILETTRQELYFINAPSERDRYIQLTDFKPCAIICRGCTREQSPLRGLVIAKQMSDIWLYLPPEKLAGLY